MPDSFLQPLKEITNPGYQHVLLLPLLVHGLLICSLIAAGCLLLRQNRAAALAFFFMLLCALSHTIFADARTIATPAMQAAQGKYLASSIQALADLQLTRKPAYWTLAGIATLALLAEATRWRFLRFCGPLAATCGIAAAIWALDFHHRESQLYHPNLLPNPSSQSGLRQESPPSR